MVSGSFRLVIVGGVIVVLLLSSLIGWMSFQSQPAVSRAETGLQALQDQHTAMLDQETGVRAFLSGGGQNFLDPYREGRAALPGIDRKLLSITGTNAELTASVIQLRIAEQRWIDGWAVPAASGQRNYSAGGPRLTAFLDQGKSLFDAYRGAHAHAAKLTLHRLVELRNQQVRVLEGATALAVAISVLGIFTGISLRNRLRRRILAPVDVLLTALAEVRAGRLEMQVSTDGPHELSQVLDGFNEMTQSLADARDVATGDHERIDEQAKKLRGLLNMTREIGGNLNSGYVLAAITKSVLGISGARRATVWLQNDAGTLTCAWDSDTQDRRGHGDDLVTSSHVSTAAKFGRTTPGHASDGAANRLAVPLIVGARVIGVLGLEWLEDWTLDEEDVELLETVAIHAATAIQAARLYEGTAHASEHDALTGLANRRRLEADLGHEVDRSRRYGNPLSFIMLDLDHFKRLNDTYGHQRGDEVLQGCAETISALLRTTDTAYRYGGEELAVLLTETSMDGATMLAERLRAGIEARYPGTDGLIGVTASFGVADLPGTATSRAGLTGAADTALYAAKRAGRNQVRQAESLSAQQLVALSLAESAETALV